MKYAVIKIVNGNYAIHSEHDNLQSALISFHNFCTALWNEPTVYDAVITILDSHLSTIGGYKEFIYHERPIETNEE